ncbi:MAG TPA: c-type cytochrome [Solirubrobacteraceae bacterium]|jgi:ubiquinol-cytochrome c reductase cytochrome c subunit
MKRRALCILLVAWVSLAGAGVAAAQPRSGIVRPTTEPSHPSVELGSELYAGNCASCHGIAGSGIRHARPGAGNILGLGPPLRGVGAIAPDFYLRTGYMPLGNPHEQPEGNTVQFTNKEIKSLVAYVASIGRGPAIPSPDPGKGDISEGQELFTENCAGCHQLEARGGFVTGARVPPLQNVKAVRIAEAVRIGPYLMPKFSKSQLSDRQLNSIIRYVVSTNHPDNQGGWSIGNLGPIPEGLVAWWIAIPLLLLFCLAVSRRMRK